MKKNYKINENCYILTGDANGARVLKGRVVGAYVSFTKNNELRFYIDTCEGAFFRHVCDMYESVEDIAKDIKNLVVE